MSAGDDLDDFIARQTAANPAFPALVDAALEAARLSREPASERDGEDSDGERPATG